MTRLTYRTADGDPLPAFTGPTWVSDIIARLAEYEDSCYNGEDEIVTPDIIRTCRKDLEGGTDYA